MRPGLSADSGSHDKVSEPASSNPLSNSERNWLLACIWWPSFGIGSGGPTFEPDSPSGTFICFTRQANACTPSGKRTVLCSHSSGKTSHFMRI